MSVTYIVIYANVKEVMWQWPCHFHGQFVVRRLELAI